MSKFVDYDRTMEPIVLSKPLLDLLLKSGDYSDLLGLYSFYYYTAKWQGTDKVYATLSYAANGIGWGIDKTRAKKNKLIKLGLIQEIQTRESKGVFSKTYIRVKYIWTKEKMEQVSNHGPVEDGHGREGSRPCGFSGPPSNTQANAYSVNSLNAYSTNSPDNLPKRTKHPESIHKQLAKYLAQIIEDNRRIKITGNQINTWSKEIEKLCKQSELNPVRVQKALDWYQQHFGEQFIPVIQSGTALREKFIQLEAAIDRGKQNNTSGKPPQSRHEKTSDKERERYAARVVVMPQSK